MYFESVTSRGIPSQRSTAVLTNEEFCILVKGGPVLVHIRLWCLRIASTSYDSKISTSRVC
jgi:hypothetical protein